MSATMTGKGKIPISAAGAMAEKYGVPVIVIFAIHPDGSNFTVTTYGTTKALCRHAASMGKQIADAVFDQRVAPEPIEPKDLPDTPCTLLPAGGEPKAEER